MMADDRCIVSRLIRLERVEKELGEILEKANRLRLHLDYVVLDDYTEDVLVFIYVFTRCLKGEYPRDIPVHRLLRMSYILSLFKKYQNRVKELELVLKKTTSNNLYEEYRGLLDKRDRLLPEISMFWEEYPELFDTLNTCIYGFEEGLDEIILDVIRDSDQYSEARNVLRRMVLRRIAYPPRNILWMWDIAREYGKLDRDSMDLVSKLKMLSSYLRRQGYREIIIVDGVEYELVVKYGGIRGLKIV